MLLSTPNQLKSHAGNFLCIYLTALKLAGAPQIKELAAAAVKEESIEAKLAALTAQWAVLSLTFQDYKTRGPVILKVRRVCTYGMVPAAQLPEHAKHCCACLHGILSFMKVQMQNADCSIVYTQKCKLLRCA